MLLLFASASSECQCQPVDSASVAEGSKVNGQVKSAKAGIARVSSIKRPFAENLKGATSASLLRPAPRPCEGQRAEQADFDLLTIQRRHLNLGVSQLGHRQCC